MLNFATMFALLSWPIISAVLFSSKSISDAVLWAIIGGQLLLPVGADIKLPMIPIFNKTTIPNFCILIGCCVASRRLVKPFRGVGVPEILLCIVVMGPFITSLLNNDKIIVGDRVLPGVDAYDGISSAEMQIILLIPFFVGRQLFRSSASFERIFRIILWAGAAYSIPMLFEWRFSPQLHNWIYGYFPTDFIQEMREGSYRPMVFMGHGLIAALFLMFTVLCSVTLWRVKSSIRHFSVRLMTIYLGVVLLISRSATATVCGIILTPILLISSAKTQIRIASCIAFVTLSYPLARYCDVFPTSTTIDLARLISDERAASLAFRFENEDKLLSKALERPYFGWGRFGRNRVYDVEGGQDVSVTDGRWIIDIGQFGLLNFIAEFGLLSIGIFRASSALKFCTSSKDGILLSALTLVISANLLDLLPNSGLLPTSWLLAGALLGRSEALAAEGKMKRKMSYSSHSDIYVDDDSRVRRAT
jgi:hypothetical protein